MNKGKKPTYSPLPRLLGDKAGRMRHNVFASEPWMGIGVFKQGFIGFKYGEPAVKDGLKARVLIRQYEPLHETGRARGIHRDKAGR